MVGTFMHLSPEALQGKTISENHDIYSLAILLWELWYGCRAYVEKKLDNISKHELKAAIIAGDRPQFTKRFSPFAYLQGIILQSWDPKHEKRPNTSEVQSNIRETYRRNYYHLHVSA